MGGRSRPGAGGQHHHPGTTLVDAEGLALPFEVASVLLLVALIGAVTIARER